MQIHGTAQTTDASVAIFAHEWREPLAAILLAVQATGETAKEDDWRGWTAATKTSEMRDPKNVRKDCAVLRAIRLSRYTKSCNNRW